MNYDDSTVATTSLTHSGKGGTAKRRPVRRDPEKRRLQNLEAQKKYRIKLKGRLEQLEQLEALKTRTVENAVTQCQSPHHHVIESCLFNTGEEVQDELFYVDHNFGVPETTNPSPSTEDDIRDQSTSFDPSEAPPTNHVASKPQHIGYIDCGCLLFHIEVSASEPKYRILIEPDTNARQTIPDPYLNTIRVDRLCIIQGIFANCAHIGILEPIFCDEDSLSPFYSPYSAPTDSTSDAGNVISTIQNMFKTLKIDMRPTREQIITPHHPMIDVLPFPTFRNNIINGGEAVDEDDLCDDLLNGLVCWGAGGLGVRERNVSTGRVTTGTPWDARSWEARPWFIRKYWVLLGGEEGELVRQSEWWRGTRGDDEDLWLGA